MALLRESKLDPATDTVVTNFENINVLVGPRESLEKLKSELDKFLRTLKGTHTPVFRLQSTDAKL